MKIGILGTGTVGQTIGSRLAEIGHEVRLGSRSARNENAAAWSQNVGGKASHGTFWDAVTFADLVFNCTQGAASLNAIKAAGEENLNGKFMIDVANPLDPDLTGSLLFWNNESIGEKIQAAFPDTKVVKALITMWCGLMVNPRMLNDSHNVFICGNDVDAKTAVAGLLESFGWKKHEILDLGDITAARGTEMVMPLWLRLWKASDSAAFNFKMVS